MQLLFLKNKHINTKMKFSAIILFHTTVLSSLFGANGFVNHQSIAFQSNVHNVKDQSTVLLEMAKKVGIFFGTSTGSTEGAAYAIQEAFSDDDVSEPIEIDSLEGKVAATFQEYDSLIVGTPTWNTGADTERSGTGWDELYYGEMQDLNIQGKNVAVSVIFNSLYVLSYTLKDLLLHFLHIDTGIRTWRFSILL